MTPPRTLLPLRRVIAAASNRTFLSSSKTHWQTQPSSQPEQQPPKPSPSTFELGNAVSAGKDQELGEVRMMTRYTQTGGDATKSFTCRRK